MVQCGFCRGRAEELARTATRVWFGCRDCRRTWTEHGENSRRIDATIPTPDADGPAQASLIRGCLIATLATLLALALRVMLRPAIGSASPFLLFTPAVMLAAFYGGLVPGALATTLSAILGSHVLLAGVGDPPLEQWDRVALFVIVGAAITASSTVLRRSRRQLSRSLWREQKARAIAEAADRTKDEFLAMVSHDLQTPASVIMGWAASIRQRDLSGETLGEALVAIERNAEVLSRLVDDILDRSRIATGRLRFDTHVIPLATVVRAAVDQVRGKAEAHGLQLDVVISDEEASVLADSVRLQQVFGNLLSNAVKFTARGGRVSIEVSVAGDEAHVIVSDTGAGIEPEFLRHVFDAFRQARTIDKSPRGLGLGLSIARYLVERHQGTIQVASAGPGRGSTFMVTLPLAGHGHNSGSRHEATPVHVPSAAVSIH